MVSAILVAAGSSRRMGGQGDKLFWPVAGRPVVAHSWMRFDQCAAVDEIVLVIRPDARALWSELAAQFQFKKPFQFVNGGQERQDSVARGLEAIAAEADLVAIHDGARPCTDAALIEAALDAARAHGAAVAATRVTDTIKESPDGVSIQRTLDRNTLWAVQTPQCFAVRVIRAALAEARRRGLTLTDDTAACELIGQTVRLVESTRPNPKITSPADIAIVEALLA